MYRTIVIKDHLVANLPGCSECRLILRLNVHVNDYFCMYNDHFCMYYYKSTNRNYIKAIDTSALVICACLSYCIIAIYSFIYSFNKVLRRKPSLDLNKD